MAATNDPNAPCQQRPAPPETLLNCLRRRLGPAFSLALLLAAVAAVAGWVCSPAPRHTVRTRLRVPPGHPVVKNGPVLDHQQHQRNEVAMARSAAVLAAALREPAVAKLPLLDGVADPVAWLERNVQVDFSVAPEIMQISMTGTRTDELKAVVRAIRDAYLTEVVERERGVRQQRLAFLVEQIQKCGDRLKLARAAQQAAIEQLGGKNPNLRLPILILPAEQLLAATERELHAAKGDLRKAKAELAALEARAAKPVPVDVPEAEINAAIDKAPEVQRLRKRIQELKTQEENLRFRVAPERFEAEVAPVRRRLALSNEELTIVTARLREQLIRLAQERAAAELQAAIRSQVNRIVILEQNVAALEADKAQAEQMAAAEKANNRHQNALDAVKHIEKLHDQFVLDKAALELHLQAPHRIALLEDVTVVRADTKAQQTLLAGAGALAAFCLGLFGVAGLEYRRAARLQAFREGKP